MHAIVTNCVHNIHVELFSRLVIENNNTYYARFPKGLALTTKYCFDVKLEQIVSMQDWW